MKKKIAWIIVFLLSAALMGYAIQGRKLAQMVADQAYAWAVFTDVGITATVAELNALDGITATYTELNLVNQGTDVVSDTFYHRVYASLDEFDFGTQNATTYQLIFAKPSDMNCKVVNVFAIITDSSTLGHADHIQYLSFYRYDGTDGSYDSLVTANRLMVDSLEALCQIWSPAINTTNATLADSDAVVVAITTSNQSITTAPRGVVTVEMYLWPE